MMLAGCARDASHLPSTMMVENIIRVSRNSGLVSSPFPEDAGVVRKNRNYSLQSHPSRLSEGVTHMVSSFPCLSCPLSFLWTVVVATWYDMIDI